MSDLIGRKFFKLLVLRDSGVRKNKHVVLECLCDCGKKIKIVASSLTTNNTKSCGCLKKGIVHYRTHGMSQTAIYMVWKGMKNRCENVNNVNYPDYGQRGIKVCYRWKRFENFYADMGINYKECLGLSLDRIDNNKGYSKENCRWSTAKQQANNRRNSHCISIQL